MTPNTVAHRRAPGQVGGKPWKGPREQMTLRVPLHVAAILRMQAKANGVGINERLSQALEEAVSSV